MEHGMKHRMTNISLHLSALGNTADAAIIAIGAVFFDPITGQQGADYEANIDLETALFFGREVDARGLSAWMCRSDAAREVFKNSTRDVMLDQAIGEFFAWAAEANEDVTIWFNGDSLDRAKLTSASYVVGDEIPHNFRWLDLDTIAELGLILHGINPKTTTPHLGTPHIALDEARHQTQYASTIYAMLNR